MYMGYDLLYLIYLSHLKQPYYNLIFPLILYAI